MKINRDFFDNPVIPEYILCKANKERIVVLQCTEKNIDIKFNDLDEINFTTYLYINGERNLYYDAIDVMKYILLPDVGFYAITSVEVGSEDTEFESKTVTAKSYECLFAQKYLENFMINMGSVESIDGVQFCNLREKDKSLLHLVFEKFPDWNIGYIDPSLITMQRSFEVSRQDIYSFLNNDVAEAFGCIFLFDTLNNTINVYKEDNIGKDTNIHVSYINLLKNTNMSCSTDNIKTCLTVTGSDDLTVREINMGYDKIYNFDYYNSTEFMSKKLYIAYNKWITLRNSKLPTYTSLLSQYQSFYTQINFLDHLKMPSVTGSTDWTEYGLQPLKEQLSAYEQQQAVSMKAGHGNPSSKFYNSEYLPIFNTIQDINTQIKVIENQIKSLKKQQDSISSKMSEIINIVSMQNNFTEEELKELTTFIREDEVNSSNYIVTDIMTDIEKFEMLNALLKYGEDELSKVSIPQLTFNADIANLYAIPEFEVFYEDFEPGNYIWVTLRDDFSIKAKLLSIHINFYDPSDFSVTFGNVVKKAKDRCLDITEAIREAKSAATSLSFNSSYWNQSAKDTSIIGKIIDEGLIAAGKYLKNGDNSEMIIDNRGIFVNTTSGEYAYKDSIFIGGGRILFTDDNWKTVSMSVGRADVTINGVTESRFGTFADFIIAGYIGGSTVEGSEIIGGIIKSSNYVAGKTGALIDLVNGTFEFNANGEKKLTLDANEVLTVKGTIKADKGYIGGSNGFIIESGKLYSIKDSLNSNANGVYIGIDGIALGASNKFKALSDGTLYAEKGYLGGTNGFVLEKSKIYNGKSVLSDSINGIYIGTDGIALGANNVFSVTPQGYFTSKSGTIGGATISNNSIHASNGNWWINSDGSATFKNISVTGVQAGSNFGSINYNNGITWGNFSGNSYYGSSAKYPFGGTTITHIEELAVSQITADRVKAKAIEAGFITADTISATYATIGLLNAVDIKVNNIAADYITTSQLNVINAKFNNLNANNITSGTISADRIDVESLDADKIISKTTGSAILSCNIIYVHSGRINLDGKMYGVKRATVNAEEVYVLVRV